MTSMRRTWIFYALILTTSPAIIFAAQPGTTDKLSRIVWVIIIAVAATLISAPFFYKRALKKRDQDKNKNLASFLMADPKTRDILLEGRGIKKEQPPPEEKAGE